MVEALLLLILAANPQCVVADREFLLWGNPGQGAVESAAVPAGKAWLVRAAGVATTDGSGAEYMMELIRPVKSENNACCWRVPLQRSPAWQWGTPVLALERPIVLLPGERISARTNGQEPEYKMALLFVYYEVSESCLLKSQGSRRK